MDNWEELRKYFAEFYYEFEADKKTSGTLKEENTKLAEKVKKLKSENQQLLEKVERLQVKLKTK